MIVFPVILVSILGYTSLKAKLVELIYLRRDSVARLSAGLLKEKFDNIIELGSAYLGRLTVRRAVEEGRWQDAIDILKTLQEDLSAVDRIFFTDLDGTETADWPRLEGGVGKNFSYRDWYVGVIGQWKPYISEVYTRAAKPQHNVVAVAFPIFSSSDPSKPTGIAVFQIRLEGVLGWLGEIDAGPGGYAYAVDKKGNAAIHPSHTYSGKTVNFGDVPAVAKALRGERGVEVLYNPIEKEHRLGAYQPVPDIGWAVIVQQPAAVAFAPMQEELLRAMTIYGFFIILALLLSYLILASLNAVARRSYREQQLLQSIGDGVFAIDRNFRITLWNRASTQISGWSDTEVIGKRFTDYVKFLSKRDHAENIAFIMRAMATGTTQYVEEDMNIMTKSGREVAIADSAAPLFDATGRPSGAIVVFRDITDRARIEEVKRREHQKLKVMVQERTQELARINQDLQKYASEKEKVSIELRESQLRFQQLIAQAPDPIITLSPIGVIEMANPAVETVSGFSPEEIIGKHFLQINIVSFDSIARVTQEFALVAMNQKRAPFDVRIKHKNGQEISVEAHGHLVDYGTGQSVQVIFRDVTERKKAQEVLAESEERYRLLVDMSPEGILLVSEGRILFANQCFLNIMRYSSAKELEGTSVMDLIVQEFHPTVAERIKTLYEQKRSVPWLEEKWIRKDATLVDVEVTASPLILKSMPGAQVIVRDISERKKMEDQLRQAQKMEAIGRLAGGIAHDFNNLLAVINGYSQLRHDQLSESDPMREDMGQILRAGQRAATLTRQLLTFSRRQVFQPKVINLNELLMDMSKMIRRLIPENIEIITIPGSGLWNVKTDPGGYEQVITNLVVNAVDALPQAGKIVISLANVVLEERVGDGLLGECVLVSVQDTGTGMSDEVKKRIFEPFFTTKEKGKGTGLGLPTSYGFIKQSGGEIEVESEVGKGTTIKVYLPRTHEPLSKENLANGQAIQQGPSKPSETILVVEDEEAMRNFVVKVLSQHGYRVLSSANGEEAMLVFQASGPVHVLLTDVIMPRMGGRDLAGRLLAREPKLKVIFMTGYSEGIASEWTSGSPRSGFFIQKPFSPQDLAKKVREALASASPSS